MKLGRLLGVSVATAIAVMIAALLLRRDRETDHEIYEQARLLDDIVAYVSRNYVDTLYVPDLYRLAIDGMLRNLGDPYTDYLEGDDIRELTMSTTGNYVGLGIRIESSDGWITVVTPLVGTPAEEAGVLPGDRIIGVDGTSTSGWTTDDAIVALRGDEGTPVDLRVARPGSPPLDFRLTRASIHVNAVRHSELVAPGIGYVWLETVSDGSAVELGQTIAALREDGATRLILDVRANPGGLLSEAIAVADLFLNAGQVVVETRGRSADAVRHHEATRDERWPNMPLAILVNDFSASAAEIIAGALQDHDRALLIGTPTFGKGLVQTVFPFSRSNVLKITTGRWFTPLGRSIQRVGRDESVALALGRADSVRDSGAVDTTLFTTAEGRRVRGGGGIYPDVFITDSATFAERRLDRILGGRVQDFRDAASTLALELKEDTAFDSAEFVVTDAMRSDLLERLRAKDINVSEEAWMEAQSMVDRQLTYLILRYVFDREAEMHRRIVDDPVVQDAIARLEVANDVGSLLRVGAGR